MDSFLFQAVVYLAAALIAVPVAQRLGLGSVLGYLVAGVVIGPVGLNLVGDAAGDVRTFAEFGVVMLLFLVGLELEPRRLWTMRDRLLGLGGLQMLLTGAALAALGYFLGAFELRVAIAGGLILALSSTAIILQTLQERGVLRTSGGEATFSILLFQALAVIPLLALWPLLGDHTAPVESGLGGTRQTLRYLIALVAIVGGGRYLIRPLFRLVAATGQRELFTISALFVVIGIATLTQWVGLSAALGTFIGGVLLADSEYRHELMADIEPFKGLLLAVFFMAVGAGVDFGLIAAQPGLVGALLAAMVGVKLLVMLVLGRLFRLAWPDTFLLGMALVVGDEFAFVMCGLSVQLGVFTPAEADLVIASVVLSMALSPLLFIVNDRLIQPRWAATGTTARRPDDQIGETDHPVILAGFGRFGHIIGRVLRGNGYGATVLDHDADQVEVLRKLGLKVFFGEASRVELLHAAGAARARLFIVAIDDRERSLQLVTTVKKHFPHLTLLVRALDRPHEHELAAAGVQHIYRETLGTSLELSADALRLLGMRAYQVRRQIQQFRRHDQESMRELAQVRHDDEAYISIARQHIENLDRILRADVSEEEKHQRHEGWEPPPPHDPSRD